MTSCEMTTWRMQFPRESFTEYAEDSEMFVKSARCSPVSRLKIRCIYVFGPRFVVFRQMHDLVRVDVEVHGMHIDGRQCPFLDCPNFQHDWVFGRPADP